MTQYSAKKRLITFGQDSPTAILKEMQQLHDIEVITPEEPEKMKSQKHHEPLCYLMFLKKKQTGQIKG